MICLSRIYHRAAAMKLCFELQHSHEMDYQNRTYFAMKFIHGTSCLPFNFYRVVNNYEKKTIAQEK